MIETYGQAAGILLSALEASKEGYENIPPLCEKNAMSGNSERSLPRRGLWKLRKKTKS